MKRGDPGVVFSEERGLVSVGFLQPDGKTYMVELPPLFFSTVARYKKGDYVMLNDLVDKYFDQMEVDLYPGDGRSGKLERLRLGHMGKIMKVDVHSEVVFYMSQGKYDHPSRFDAFDAIISAVPNLFFKRVGSNGKTLSSDFLSNLFDKTSNDLEEIRKGLENYESLVKGKGKEEVNVPINDRSFPSSGKSGKGVVFP